MTQTYVWGKFLAAEPPVRDKNGPSHSSPAPPNVSAKLSHVSLFGGYCLKAKTCSALNWDGNFTVSLFFAQKCAGSTFEVSLQPVRSLVVKNCAIKSPRKTIGINGPLQTFTETKSQGRTFPGTLSPPAPRSPYFLDLRLAKRILPLSY